MMWVTGKEPRLRLNEHASPVDGESTCVLRRSRISGIPIIKPELTVQLSRESCPAVAFFFFLLFLFFFAKKSRRFSYTVSNGY